MNPPRLLVQRVRLWQRRLKLDAWDLELKYEPATARDALARWPDHANRASLIFNSNKYPEWTDEYLDLTICHELYHLLTARVDDAISDHVGRVGAVYKAYSKADEAAADAFATILVASYRRRRT